MSQCVGSRLTRTSLVTHQYSLDDIEEAFDLFSHQRDGVLKVALYPHGVTSHDRRDLTSIGAVHATR